MNMNLAYWLQSLLLLFVSILFRLYPPKNVNSIYGYRTPSSMKNGDTWKKANDYSSSLFLKLSICLVIIQVVMSLTIGVNLKTVVISCVLLTLSMPIIILFTENYLKK
jgi:uncharacterized membrane protein